MYETRFTVRSTQVDTFGHLNNAAYLEIYEWARWEWAREADMDLEEMMARDRVGPAILHIDLSFRRELRMHEPVTVRTWTEEAGSMRAVVGQEMVKADGTVASAMRLTFVMFHLDERRAVKLPDAFREAAALDASYREARARGGA